MHYKGKRIKTILIAKGIGIVLVVAGHYVPEFEPPYWIMMREVIYRFHMPLFFMLSGYLFSFTAVEPGWYVRMLQKKIKRLIYPFLSVALIVFIIKYLAGLIFNLQHPLTMKSFFSVFINPGQSFHPLLWFMHALFIIFAIFPLLLFLRRKSWLLVSVTILLLYPKWPSIFSLRAIFDNLPIFALGYLAGSRIDLDAMGKESGWMVLACSTALFAGTYLIGPLTVETPLLWPLLRFVLAFSGCMACISMSSLINAAGGAISRVLAGAGFYSMSIYLMHTLFESFVRIIFHQRLDAGRQWFLPVAVLAILAGTVIPLLAEKYILRKYPLTRRYILGLDVA